MFDWFFLLFYYYFFQRYFDYFIIIFFKDILIILLLFFFKDILIILLLFCLFWFNRGYNMNDRLDFVLTVWLNEITTQMIGWNSFYQLLNEIMA